MTTAQIDPKKASQPSYNSFVRELGIKDIRLTSATIENMNCPDVPAKAEVSWKIRASYKNHEGDIDVFHRYIVSIVDERKQIKAKLSVTFCVTYQSKRPMTDELFARFKVSNLPVNTWPYFREFIHNAVQRMGWPPFIAPTFVA